MNKPANKIWIIVILFLIAAIIIGLFFYLKNTKKQTKTTSSQRVLWREEIPSVKKIQETGAKYTSLIVRTGITQIIQGKLVKKDEDGWTLEKNGQTWTLSGENSPQIRYLKIVKNSAVDAKFEDIILEHEVSISRMTDWQSAESMITSVTILD